MGPVAVMGLGAMGGAIARRLLCTGHDVIVWNRSPAPVADMRDAGASVAASPADAAGRAQWVIAMVSDPQALRDITEGTHGIAAGIGRGTQVIQMSTVSRSALAGLVEALPPGTPLLDAPVLGSVAQAASGTLQILVGGPKVLADACVPLLQVLGSALYLGDVGAGTAAKLVANNALFGVLGVLGEALALGDALGLSRPDVFDLLALTPLAAQTARRRESFETDTYPARFALRLARKDADLIDAAAHELGLDLGLTTATRSWLAAAERDGRADQDYAAVLAHIRYHAGK